MGTPGGPVRTAEPDASPADHELDDWLVGRARDGDLEAFDALVRRHRDRIYRIALRMLGDPSDAEDIAQDVVIQLWTGLAGFAGSSRFTTWLYRVVVNRCLNHRRRGPRTDTAVPEPDEPGHPTAPSTERRVTQRMRLAATVDAVAGLPREQRSVFVLVQMERLAYADAARVLRVSEGSVRNRLSRARATLARELREWM